MSRSSFAIHRLVAFTALCAPSPVLAQAVDYAALEAMIGEPVTTSVTGKPQRVSEAPAAITIITREDIARSPARDVPGLLKSYAGLDVNRWTAGQSDIAVRGGVESYNPRLLVMVNGRQVYLDQYGYTNWNLLGIQLEEIQQIELVRGPASALFGFNAASGVVNIITVDATSDRLNVTAEGGNHGISRFAAVAGLSLGRKAGFRLSAGRSREDQRAVPAGRFDPQNANPVRREEVAGTLTLMPTDRDVVSIEGSYAHDHQLEYLASPTIGDVRTKMHSIGAHLSHDSGWGSIDGQVYANWSDFLNPPTTANQGGYSVDSFGVKNRVLVGKAAVLARLGANTTLRVGGEYRHNRVDSAMLYSSRLSYNQVAANAMIDTHPIDRLTLTGAVRIDRVSLRQSGALAQPVIDAADPFNRSLSALSFNLAALLDMGNTGQLRVNAGRGIQAPSLLALGIHLPTYYPTVPFPIVIVGEPTLQTPQVWSAEIGYARPLGTVWKIEAAAYAAKTDELIAFSSVPVFTTGPTGQSALATRVSNIGDLVTYGAELSLTGSSGRWSWLANYSWTLTDDRKLLPHAATLYSASQKVGAARHKANAQISHDGGSWFATLTGRYTSPTRQPSVDLIGNNTLVRVPATVAFDAKVGWHVARGTTLTIAGENLTAARGAAGSPIWADRRLRAGVSVAL